MVARTTQTPPESLRGHGLFAAATAGLFAGTLGLVATLNRLPSPPTYVPAGLILAAILLTPAAIGALGAVSGRRVLLVAAGLLCLAQSILAFSGVTLILLLPALLFLRAAVAQTPGSVDPARPGAARVNPLRWVALIALAVPVALFVVLNLGVFGLVALIAFAGVVGALGRRNAPRVRVLDALVGIAVVALVVGAMAAFFALTEAVCWNERQTPGGVVYERVPGQLDSGAVPADSDIVSSGCSGGEPTIPGAAVTAVLLATAIGVAALAARGAGGRDVRAP
jgi:hypothetical protein